jgi:hypothetical protein
VVPTGCVEVSDDAAVSAALAGATPGSCILMAAGSYKAVDLPGGVSLFGRSAADVTVAGVIVDAGDNAVIRGLSVGAGGLTISPGATKVQVTSVRVSKSLSDGIQIGAGASVTVTATEVEDAGRYGIHAKDADATLEKVIVSRAEGPGLWAESTSCDAHCNCTPPREVQVARSILRDNRILGISTIGVSATLDSVDVTGTKSGDHFSYSQFGGGLSVSQCSTFSAKRLRVLDSADWGILVDNSRAMLGSDDPADDNAVERNLRGVWVQNISTDVGNLPLNTLMTGLVELHGLNLKQNRGVSFGVAGDAHSVIICRSKGEVTEMQTLPTDDQTNLGASQMMGDGFNWLGTSEVRVEDLKLSQSARQSFLIDGPVGGTQATSEIKDLDQSGDMAAQALVLQQRVMSGDLPPGGDVDPAKHYTLQTDPSLKRGFPPALSGPASIP